MDSLCRRLLLPASENCQSCNRYAGRSEANANKDRRQTNGASLHTQNSFLNDYDDLLKSAGVKPCATLIEFLAAQIANHGSDCYHAGFDAGVRRSAQLRAEKARNGKRERSDKRGRILRQAIVAVCTQQKIIPTASLKFAASIQEDVIATARQFGLSDLRNGTSSRSIQRHIETLVKDMRMP